MKTFEQFLLEGAILAEGKDSSYLKLASRNLATAEYHKKKSPQAKEAMLNYHSNMEQHHLGLARQYKNIKKMALKHERIAADHADKFTELSKEMDKK